jgi:shikimate dehydrogenase
MILSGKARLAGVLGWPVTHSLSPRLHGYWLEQHGIDGAYLPLAAKPKALSNVVSALVELGFRGFNVTIPHKESVRGLCHALDPDAERIGAVNTVVIEDGRLRGSNSDAFGFMANLRQGAPAWQADAGPAVVLGAGGAARAVIVALLDAGVPAIRLCNRTPGRAEALASMFRPTIETVPWGDDAALLDGAALLVNCTSLGMNGQPPLELDMAKLPRNALVADLVYAPLETALLSAARQRGNPTVDGLGMLLHQARRGFASWFEVEPEVTEELRRFVLAG